MSLNGIKKHYVKHESNYVWGLFIFFFVLRILYVGMFGNYDKSTFMDATGYNEYAKTILHDPDWLHKSEFPASWREPVYPVIIASIYSMFGEENFLAVYLLQALISALMLVLVYRLAYLVARRRIVALLSMVWSGFYIFYIRWIGDLLRETVTFFLLLAFFYCMALLLRSAKVRGWAMLLLAVLYTLLIHTDGRYLFYAPFLIVPFLIYCRSFRIAIKQYAFFGLAVLMLTVPWTIRNYFAYNELIVVSELTLNFSADKLSSRKELFNTAPIDSAYSTLHFNNYNQSYPDDAERRLVAQGFNPLNRSTEELKAIKQGKRASRTWLGRKLYFIQKMWSPVIMGSRYSPFPMAQFEGSYSRGHNIASAVQYGAMLPFLFIALVAGYIKKERWIVFPVIPIVIHAFLHFFTFGIERYRHPIDAFVFILAFTGFVFVVDYLYQKASHKCRSV